MTLDSGFPTLYQITIDGSTFTDPAPADGFIDPCIIEKYMAKWTLTGSDDVDFESLNAGDSFSINDYTIVLDSFQIADIDGVVAAINAAMGNTRVAATKDGDVLILTNSPGYEGNTITLGGTDSVLTNLKMKTPTKSSIPGSLPSSLVLSTAKARSNCRWKFVIEQLERDAPIMFVGGVQPATEGPGEGDVDNPYTFLSFTIAVPGNAKIYTYDEVEDDGSFLEGTIAIKRMIARALCEDKYQLFPVFDPTTYGDGDIVKGTTILKIRVGKLSSSISSAESVITVTNYSAMSR